MSFLFDFASLPRVLVFSFSGQLKGLDITKRVAFGVLQGGKRQINCRSLTLIKLIKGSVVLHGVRGRFRYFLLLQNISAVGILVEVLLA